MTKPSENRPAILCAGEALIEAWGTDYAALHVERPLLGILAAQELFLTYCPFRWIRALQEPDFSLVKMAIRARSVCTHAPKNVKCGVSWRKIE